ncbi:hypothetical protein GCM10022247_37170 [Allokutzneria multivorans]|uniref:Cytochrome P450 n=1 Tax=Allokutzneria multivorans TaxID=1142134 RepID=A0ABP7SG89_9PSEU
MSSSSLVSSDSFTVPDVRLPFHAPSPRPDGEELRARAIHWGERHGLIGPRGGQRLAETSLLGLGVALTGTAPAAGAAVLMDWFLWAVVLDDRIDDGPWAENGVLDRFTEAVRAVTGGEQDDLRDPMVTVLAQDLWPRTASLADSAWLERLRAHLLQHLDAQRELVRIRSTTTDIGVDDYVLLRRHTFGALLFFDLIEAADGTEPHREALREQAADIVSWTNDIHSVAKDMVLGERFNLVTVLAHERGLTLQAAVDAANAMLTTAANTFARQPATRRLEEVMSACADWHRTTSRYHLQAGVPEQRTVHSGQTPPTLKSRQFEVDPHPLYERLRAHHPLTYDEPTDTWLLSRHGDVRAALTDSRFTNANYTWQISPLLGHSLISMDGREHTAHRALLTPQFRSRALAVLHESITEVAASLVEGLREHADGNGGRVDLVEHFSGPLPVRVIARVLGLPADTAEQVERMRGWTRVGFSYLGNYRQDPGMLTYGLASRDTFYDYLRPHLEARRADPGDDLISAMFSSEVDGQPLSAEYVRGCCAILLTAGSETSTAGLTNMIVNVLDEPGVRDAVLGDPELLDRALVETLRRDPPTHVVLRQAAEAVELPSGTVPAGATVACLIGSANRDPRRFERPDEFDLHRPDGLDREYSAASSHVAFGAGRHFCLGSHLVRAELTTGVRALLEAFPDLRWASGSAPVPTGFIKRCPPRLDVIL